jgi:ribose transport system substrate-binding protein
LIDNVAHGGYQGLVLAPNHPLAILGPLRRAVAAGVPVVVISTPLDLPASANLGYIVNDDLEMGALAAAEIARLIGGRGSIAFVGLSRNASGVSSRARGAEQRLADQFPDIHVVGRRGGAFSASSAQETANALLAENPDLKAILSFTANATRGVHAALTSQPEPRDVSLVGCEQDTDLIEYVGTGEIAGVVAMNTYQMAYQAVAAIAAARAGKAMPPMSIVPPMLLTKQSLPLAEARFYVDPPR